MSLKKPFEYSSIWVATGKAPDVAYVQFVK